MRCKFCFHLFGRSNYFFRSPHSIIEEMEELISCYGVDFIGFVDDNFTASQSRTLEICRLIKERGFHKQITWGCHSRVDHITPTIAHELASAGCTWIGFGIESASQRILDAMNKNTTPEECAKAIRITREAGMYANTTFIFGFPGETPDTTKETIAFKKALNIKCGSFFATPYPSTPLFESTYSRISQKFETLENYILHLGDATDFVINLTAIPDEEFFELKQKLDEA